MKQKKPGVARYAITYFPFSYLIFFIRVRPGAVASAAVEPISVAARRIFRHFVAIVHAITTVTAAFLGPRCGRGRRQGAEEGQGAQIPTAGFPPVGIAVGTVAVGVKPTSGRAWRHRAIGTHGVAARADSKHGERGRRQVPGRGASSLRRRRGGWRRWRLRRGRGAWRGWEHGRSMLGSRQVASRRGWRQLMVTHGRHCRCPLGR